MFSCHPQDVIKLIENEIRTFIIKLKNRFETPNPIQSPNIIVQETVNILQILKNKTNNLSGCDKNKMLNSSKNDIVQELENELMAFDNSIDENDNLFFINRSTNYEKLMCKNYLREFHLLKYNV